MKIILALAAFAIIFAAPGFAQAAAPLEPEKEVAELSVTYAALHANAPVGDCGCFWMHGGSAEVAVPVWRYVSGVVELSGEHISNLPGAPGVGLGIVSGLGGVRVSRAAHAKFVPFGQGLFGAVHAFDSYFPGAQRSTTYATSFAMAAGIGLDVGVSRHLAIRPIQAEYQYMQLPNNSTDQQHDIRLSAGVVVRFTR